MKRSIYSILGLFVILAGCGSFNNSFNTYTLPATKIEKADKPDDDKDALSKQTSLGSDEADGLPNPSPVLPKVAQKIVVENESVACPVSPYPHPGTPPEIPVQELQAAAGDVYAIERIERKHINELRAYIMERRKLQREARQKFNEQCLTVTKH